MSKSQSYSTSECCGSDCCMLGYKESEPCWGLVELIGEDVWGDDDDLYYEWVHACSGHHTILDGGEYEREE